MYVNLTFHTTTATSSDNLEVKQLIYILKIGIITAEL